MYTQNLIPGCVLHKYLVIPHFVHLCRFASRSLLIEFTLPQLSMSSVTEYSQLPELMSAATSAIGFTISLGQKFVTSGISDIDTVIFPKLRALLPEGVWPRVVPGYATLVWFTKQVCTCQII